MPRPTPSARSRGSYLLILCPEKDRRLNHRSADQRVPPEFRFFRSPESHKPVPTMAQTGSQYVPRIPITSPSARNLTAREARHRVFHESSGPRPSRTPARPEGPYRLFFPEVLLLASQPQTAVHRAGYGAAPRCDRVRAAFTTPSTSPGCNTGGEVGHRMPERGNSLMLFDV